MSLSAACIFQFVLFLYEYLAWQLEIKNYTTHNHYRELFGTNAYFLTVQINSLPHLAAAYVYYHRILPRFKDHAVIPDTEHTILFILTCLTFFLTIRSVVLVIKNKYLKKKIK